MAQKKKAKATLVNNHRERGFAGGGGGQMKIMGCRKGHIR